MNVVMVASEVVPFSKTGGLADVVGTLPRALAAQGVTVSVVTPYYRQVRDADHPIEPLGKTLSVPLGGESRKTPVHLADVEGVKVYFLENAEFYDRDDLYGTARGEYPDNAARFAFLARGALELWRGSPPDILHAHDWQAGLLPALVRTTLHDFFPKTRTVMTIHNLAYQGLFNAREWPLTGLDSARFNWQELEFYGKINFLKGGIVFADAVTTVSPTYAREIQREEFGCGLDGVLRHRSSRLYGILNGVDYRQWDPKDDPLIPAPYTPRSLEGKSKAKDALQKKCGLPKGKSIPLVGMITRLAEQKGLDLFLNAAERLTKDEIQFVILGTGNPYYEEALRGLARRFPEHFSVTIGFDNALAHEIEAGADMFLMPSRYEPCGLNQIYSLRYGTIPLVRATGGLADTVVDVTTESLHKGAATGFRFEEYSPDALYACIQRALSYYRDGAAWKKIVRAAMKQDFSWDRSAARYIELYRSL
jgi:starch synthase